MNANSRWLFPVSFALAYFAGAELGHLLSLEPGHLATIWPPSGLYLAVLLFTPPSRWARLMAAAALADLASAGLHGDAMWVSASFWLARTLEAAVGAALLRSLFPIPFALDRLTNTLGLAVVCSLLSAPAGAIVGALTVRIAFGSGLTEAWLTWWIADVVGILVFAPLVLAFKDARDMSLARLSRWRMLEAGLFALTTALVATVVFGLMPGRPVRFAVYPCLLWGALRFGLRGVSSGLAVVSTLAVSFALSQWGAVSAADLPPLSGMHVVQLFLSVTALSFLCLAAVIDERDHASHELREVIDTIPTGVGAALPDGSMEFVNRRWSEYSGMEDSSGSRWQAAVHPDDLARHMEKWRASVASGEPFEHEVRYRRAADGRYRWFVVRAVPLRDMNGTIRKWYGVSTDIDYRRRTEALLAGEKRILEMVARGDSLGHVLDGLCRLVEEQAPDVLASVLLVDGDRLRHGAAPSLPKAYTDAVDGAPIGPTAGSCGTAAHRGQPVIVSDIATDPLWTDYRDLALPHSLRACWSTPILSSDGSVIATFAMYYREPRSPSPRDQDIVEQITHVAGIAIQRKRAEEALQRAQTELAHVTRVTTLGQLAASIAHEVNQPLAAIVADATASLNWLATAKPDLDQVREALAAIVKDGHRAGDIIQRIRQLATKTEPRNARLNINDVVRDVVILMRAELQRHDIGLVPQLAADLPFVLGDRVQLQQVLLNLVVNAVEAMAAVTGRPRQLIIRSEPHGQDQITVAVHDTGVGVDRDDVDKLFDAFFTTKPDGMGMGLSISRSILEAHGGRLWTTARSPHGATFYFSLPVDVDRDGDPPVPAHARTEKLRI